MAETKPATTTAQPVKQPIASFTLPRKASELANLLSSVVGVYDDAVVSIEGTSLLVKAEVIQ